VADGLWSAARDLLLSNRRAGRRASVLRPQERLAALLSAREDHLLCEELTLRARLDLDGARIALAAVELERAYAAALAELPSEQREDLRERVEELERLRPGVVRVAQAVLPAAALVPSAALDTTSEAADAADAAGEASDEQTVRHALQRLEAALRARTAHSSTLR
jgi:hypothetical protein